MTRPDLTDAEVDALCDGLRQNAAKVRFLRGLGLTVATRPNGRPLVNRTHYDAVCNSGTSRAAVSNEPNWSKRA